MIWFHRLMNDIRNEKGFTLVEVVIGIVVIAIVVPPLLLVLSSIVLDNNVNEITDTASYLAERELERVLSFRFDAIVNEGPTSYTGNFSNYTYQIAVSAIEGTDPPDIVLVCGLSASECKKIEITISHINGASLYLTTMATNT